MAQPHEELRDWWQEHGPRFEASSALLHDALPEAALREGLEAAR